MSFEQGMLVFWGVTLIYTTARVWYFCFKEGLYKEEGLSWGKEREFTGFVGTKIGPLVIGEQIGSVKTKNTSKKK